jgi:hypothetical protein
MSKLIGIGVGLATLLGCTTNSTPLPAVDAGPTAGCLPDLDGIITPEEFPALSTVHASFVQSAPGEEPGVDVAGVIDDTGRLVWDFSHQDLGTTPATTTTLDLSSQWYANRFSGAEFSLATADGNYHQIYAQTDAGLWLHGIASAVENPGEGQTLIVYADPVLIYRFPLARDEGWSSVGEVTAGLFAGIAFTGRDTYDVVADATGWMVLPDFTLTQVHRLRFSVTNAPNLGTTTRHQQVSFLFECLGEVARVQSLPGETSLDFSVASSVRRLIADQ